MFDAGVYFMATEFLFYAPGISDFLTWTHAGPASKENMLKRMGDKQNLAILPGGFEEATLY